MQRLNLYKIQDHDYYIKKILYPLTYLYLFYYFNKFKRSFLLDLKLLTVHILFNIHI
jgi:hypothetical protein